MLRSSTPVVLIVDDEPALVELYRHWLGDGCETMTAGGGTEALSKLDDTVDVVLLDRSMPGLSGDDVLGEIRDRGFSCRVAMITGVDPDYDILDLGFDDYVCKPVTKETLRGVVEGLLRRSTYGEGIQQYFALASKKSLLESQKHPADLASSEDYAALVEELGAVEDRVDGLLRDFEENDFLGLFYDLDAVGADGNSPLADAHGDAML